MKLLVVDIETTGFEVKDDAIVEIGIVLVDTKTKKTEIVFNEIIKHEGKFNLSKHENSWIFQNTTLKPEDVVRAKSLEFYRDKIQKLFDTYKMTAYNKAFDIKFLSGAGFKLNDVDCLMKSSTKYSNYRFPNGRKKIPSVEEIYNQFFMNENEVYIEKHRAGVDALDEARILLHLVDLKSGTAKIENDKVIIFEKKNEEKPKGIGVNDVLKFGKYKGRIFSEVVTRDINYLKWCIENVPTFQLTPEAKKLLN